MTPFFFGEGQRRLFGVYDPAEGSNAKVPRAVVFCAPWGPEYTFSHGVFRRLALNLAAGGYHVLRFDYFGAGDSAGESTEADLEGWGTDIDTAIDELKSMAGALRVSLVGARIGAALAAEVAARRIDIDRLVLWDPVVVGRSYLDELDLKHAAWVNERTRYLPLPPADMPNRLCHPLPARVEQQMAAIDLAGLLPRLKRKILLVLSESRAADAATLGALASVLLNRLTIERVRDQPPWKEDSLELGGPIPVNALGRITAWMG
jgi:pimeloyl-ACP methyl ester carboxylesterase